MNTQKGLAPLVWAIIIAVLLVGGYICYRYFFQAQGFCWPYCPNMTDQDREDVKRSTLEAQMSDWKTYRNEKYGFELKYPPGWEHCSLDTEKNHEKSAVQLFCIEQSIPDDSLGQSKVVRLLIDLEKVGAFNTYKKLLPYLKAGHESASKVGLYSVFKEGTTGSVSFIQSGAGDVGTWGHFYVFLKENHILAVGYNNATDTVEQMLSTFKFTK